MSAPHAQVFIGGGARPHPVPWLFLFVLISRGVELQMEPSQTDPDDLTASFEQFTPFAAPPASVPATGASASVPLPDGIQLPPVAPEAVAHGRHWSGVEPGQPFRLQVSIGRPPQTFYVNMLRRPSGISKSLDLDWPWAPAKSHGDSKRHAEDNFFSDDRKLPVSGRALRNRLLGIGSKAKQSGLGLFFQPSPGKSVSSPGSVTSVDREAAAAAAFAPSPSPSTAHRSTPQDDSVSGSRKAQRTEELTAMNVDSSEPNFTEQVMAALLRQTMSSHIDLPMSGPLQLCAGFQLPSALEPIMWNYPFAYHSSTTMWTPPGLDGRVFSSECKGHRLVHIVEEQSSALACKDCLELSSNATLAAVIQRASDTTVALKPGVRDGDLSHSQMRDRGRMHKQRESIYRVTLFHKVRRHLQTAICIHETDDALLRLL